MAADTLKAQAQTRDLKVGHFIVEFATPGIGHMLKNAGCDFVLFDTEHSGFHNETIKSVMRYFEAARLPVQPTWLPFTPWTSLGDYIDMLVWIRERNLITHVPAVQLSIRLLIPPNSALVGECEPGLLGQLDRANFSYAWRHPDPRMDELQARVTIIAEGAADSYEAFAAAEQIAYATTNRSLPTRSSSGQLSHHIRPAPPRLTEDWFC